MEKIALILLYLAIALAVLLFFGPIVIIISIIGNVKLGPVEINLSQLGRLARTMMGILGLGVWLSVYIPLILLALRASQPITATPLLITPMPVSTPIPTTTLTLTPTNIPTPTPTITPLSAAVTATDGSTMILIPAGPFEMGGDTSGYSEQDEYPVHEAMLDDYYIDHTEVTNAQFAAFAANTGYMTNAERRGESYVLDPSLPGNGDVVENAAWQYPFGPTSSVRAEDTHPVVHVSWYDAVAYCEWRGDRLPTEAEWEKAARSDDGRTYPWGNRLFSTVFSFCDLSCPFDYHDKTTDDGYPYTAPVGIFPDDTSPYGVLDMAGNVQEWVADWYGEDYYAASSSVNPRGPSLGEERVTRGGSWTNSWNDVRVARRMSGPPSDASNNLGFRCARSP